MDELDEPAALVPPAEDDADEGGSRCGAKGTESVRRDFGRNDEIVVDRGRGGSSIFGGTGDDGGITSSTVLSGGVDGYRFGVDAADASDAPPYDRIAADLLPCSARFVGDEDLPPGPLLLELANETSLRLPIPKLRLPRKMSRCPRSPSSSVSPSSMSVSSARRSSGLV